MRQVTLERATSAGIETRPATSFAPAPTESALVRSEEPFVNVTSEAAHVLVETLFAGTHQRIPKLRFAIAYKLAEGRTGGDIIDVFHYDNDQVSIGIADIAGKGTRAAALAALIKYGLRAYASSGMVAENVIRGLNRLYLENNAFENMTDSFATAFFGIIDSSRRFMQYSNAGHEPAMLVHPDGSSQVLEATAPLIGVFDDQPHLFSQNTVAVARGSLFVAVTDGVTEARNDAGDLFGLARVLRIVRHRRKDSEPAIVEAILEAVEGFARGWRRDDIAILVNRFL